MIQRYEKIIKRRRAFAIVFALLGAAILIALFSIQSDRVPHHLYPFFGATGFSLIANGVVSCYRKNKLLHDAEALQKAAFLEFDERTHEVTRRSAYLTLLVLLYAGWIAAVAAAFFSETVCYTLMGCIAAGRVIFVVCYSIVWKTI